MWLVIGKNGQLGQCLSDLLVSKSVDHISLSKSDLDITDTASVKKVLSQIRPNFVVNAAAFTAVDNAEDDEETAHLVNAVGPANLVRACTELSSRFIQISTDYVFSGESTKPYEVGARRNPINVYGRTKLAGEQAVPPQSNGEFSIVRTAWLYSEYGKNFAKTMVERALNSQPSMVINDQFGQPTSAHDLSSLIFELGQMKSMPYMIHGTNRGIASWFEFALEIYRITGAETSLVTEMSSEKNPSRAKRPRFTVLSNDESPGEVINPLPEWRTGLHESIGKIISRIRSDENL